MSVPILATKLHIPAPRPELVFRPRLVEQLNRQHSKLTLISAPAGFGKTTLISAWLAACNRPVAWLSLDDGDGDPIRFLTYIIAALQTVDGNTGTGIASILQASEQPPIEPLLTTLVNDIARSPISYILVLDDYHLIESKAVDQMLAFILDHQPPQMQIVICTREDPSLPLARMRARGQMTELRSADLRFTPSETAEFLNRSMGLNLSTEDISALESRTEGWITGLQLAALSMRGHKDTESFIRSFTGSHRFVLDYLIEEVLGQQPEKIQAFLLRTSMLDRMCGTLCDAVLLDPSISGQETLEQLERANLFIIPMDDERHWYRYHHLFGDLLRQRLGQPSELSEYHLRASAWYEANADHTQSFHHALEAGDNDRAARLAEAAWQGMERNFQTSTWLGWIKKLPAATVDSRPWLCVLIGWGFSDTGELEQSEVYLQKAERVLAGKEDQQELKTIPSTIALIRSSNAQNEGDLVETVRLAELSIQLASEEDLLTRAQAEITLGFTHWANGDVESSLRALNTWINDMQKLGNQMFAIASTFVLADMQVILGHLTEAGEVLRTSIQEAKEIGPEAEIVTAHHHLGLAMLAHERGEDAELNQYLQSAAELGKRTELIDWAHRWNLAQARIKESERDWDAALDLLDAARLAYVKNPVPILQPIAAQKARIHLRQGRLEQAQAWARECRLTVHDEVTYLGEYQYLTLVRIRVAEGSFSGVNDLLDRLLTLAESQNRIGSVIEILLTQALLFHAQGEDSMACKALKHSFALAEPEGYLRTFLNEGDALRSLLQYYRSTFTFSDQSLQRYAEKLLNASANPREIYPNNVPQPRLDGLVEPLTSREIEILQLIAEGRSNTEISNRLFLALSTVKGHNLRIFNKLQVENRTEAAARARELGVL